MIVVRKCSSFMLNCGDVSLMSLGRENGEPPNTLIVVMFQLDMRYDLARLEMLLYLPRRSTSTPYQIKRRLYGRATEPNASCRRIRAAQYRSPRSIFPITASPRRDSCGTFISHMISRIQSCRKCQRRWCGPRHTESCISCIVRSCGFESVE